MKYRRSKHVDDDGDGDGDVCDDDHDDVGHGVDNDVDQTDTAGTVNDIDNASGKMLLVETRIYSMEIYTSTTT